jgi:hypothetical protein
MRPDFPGEIIGAGGEPAGESAVGDREMGRPALDLEEFMRILPHLDSSELLAMSATYREADAEARDAARRVASAKAKERGLGDDLSRLQGSIIQWAGSDISQSSAITLAGVRPDQVLGDLRVQAVPPLLDAATALLLRDALPDDARDALIEPWSAAVS